MKCFYHTDADAVGICKSCSKGLCPACAVDMNQGIACKGRCESQVANLIALVNSNVKMAPVVRNGLRLSAIFLLILGMIFLATCNISGHIVMFNIYAGGTFLLFGVINLIRVMKSSK